MQLSDLVLFELASSSAPLAFAGEIHDGRLINGVIHAGAIGEVDAAVPAGSVLNEVAFFREPGDMAGNGWGDEGIHSLVKGNRIARNWENETAHAGSHPIRSRFCDELSCVDGPILEVAAGPGGGNVPPVLRRNPEAHIIMNDWSYRVLRLWNEFLASHGDFPNVCCATFDARRMPLRDESVAAISSSVGFSEIIPDGEQALNEAYRVLRRGGQMYCMESSLEADNWEGLPIDIRAKFEAAQFLGGFGQALTRAGFKVISKQLGHRRALTVEESEAQRAATQHGVQIYSTFYWYEALKG